MPTSTSVSAALLPTSREAMLAALGATAQYDIIVIGGGATGLGVALDAASRGLKVALLEAQDFAKGTSSRATKLVHGGVRYLAQGNIALVKEALHERAVLLRNASHLAKPLSFVMPSYAFWESAFYGAGLKMYDALAGKDGLGATGLLTTGKVCAMLPNVNRKGLRGGVQYWDGQFDDARLALALARTAAAQGAHLMNYCPVQRLLHDAQGKVCGVVAKNAEDGETLELRAPCVINATGVWVDHLRSEDAKAGGKTVREMVSPSQGVHIVVDKKFWPQGHALLVPKTRDGRVLFAVPWLGKVILGTTDTPRSDKPLEPRPFEAEVDFILAEAARYLAQAPARADVRSVWVGLRPLVKPDQTQGDTKAISREHTIEVSNSGLVTVTGGKWTTYRAMAQDVIQQCQLSQLLPVNLPACKTSTLRLLGAQESSEVNSLEYPLGLNAYGTEAALVNAMPGPDVMLDDSIGLTEAMVRFAVRHEYARTVEDVLARRCRLLFLDAQRALALADRVAALLEEEGCVQTDVVAFKELAAQYLP